MLKYDKNQDIDELTTDELLEQIEADKKQVKKSSVFAIAALVAIIALCIAWFASNRSVRATGSAVSANADSVELKTYGSAGIHDDLLKKLMKQENPQDENWYTKILEKTGLETSTKKCSVNWLLNDQNSIGNYSTEKTDWEEYWKHPDDNDERKDHAIEPGSEGKLQFSIVPKKSGTITCNLQLSMLPYKYDNGKFNKPSEWTKNFVSGHILLFLVHEENGTKTIDRWLSDEKFSIVINNAEKDSEYSYTVYWCWPQNFAEIAMKADDPYLNNRSLILSEYTNGDTFRGEIISSMQENPERYFYSNLTQKPLEKGQKDLSQITEIGKAWSSEVSEEVKNSFVDLSSYYNQADRYMGSDANCLRVKLEMESLP